MFTVKFTFSEPFAILPVTSSHLHILILLVLVIMGAYILSLHLLLDVHNSLVSIAVIGIAVIGIAVIGIAVVGVVGVAVVTHRSSLFSVMEKKITFSKYASCSVGIKV